jgi:hypothetical protein
MMYSLIIVLEAHIYIYLDWCRISYDSAKLKIVDISHIAT